MSAKGKKIGFLGGGNMGEALIRGLAKTGLIPPDHLFVTDVRLERLEELGRRYGLHTLSDNTLLVRRVDVVILAVKPQILASVLREVAAAVPGRLMISIAAGVSTAAIRSHLPPGVRLIRTMPNAPALVLEAATAIARADGLEAGDLIFTGTPAGVGPLIGIVMERR